MTSLYNPTTMDDFEVLDPTIYPMTHIYDSVQNREIPIQQFEFTDAFWDMSHVPSGFQLPAHTKIAFKDLITRMDEIERPYKVRRQLLRDDELCAFLQDIWQDDTIEESKGKWLQNSNSKPAEKPFSLFVIPKKEPRYQKGFIKQKKRMKPQKKRAPKVKPIQKQMESPLVSALAPAPEEDFEVESIIAHIGHWDYLSDMWFRVRWLGYTENDDTWEPYENLDGCSAILESYQKKQTISLYLNEQV